jgi:hypothetical protein
VSEDPSAWTIIECRWCGTRLKLPQAAKSRRLQCPKCLAIVPSDAGHGESIEAAGAGSTAGRQFVHALPSNRNVLGQPIKVRGEEKEEWERQKSALKNPGFEAHIGRIGADVPQVEHVRMKKKRKLAAGVKAPKWETPDTETERRDSRRVRRLVSVEAGVALCIVLLLGVWAHRRAAPNRAVPAAAGSASGVGVPDLTEEDPAALDFPTVAADDYAAVAKVVNEFCSVRSPAGLLPVVRDATRVRPMIEAYYRERPFQPAEVKSLPKRGEMFAYQNIIVGHIEFANFDRRIVAIEKTPKGYFLDWESYVGWSEVPWEQLGTARPIEPVIVRARVKDDDYYNHTFADPARLACYRLSSFDGTHVVYGYVERRNPLFADLQARTQLNRLILATLKVRFISKSGPSNQVEITELVEDGWVLKTERSKAAATPKF